MVVDTSFIQRYPIRIDNTAPGDQGVKRMKRSEVCSWSVGHTPGPGRSVQTGYRVMAAVMKHTGRRRRMSRPGMRSRNRGDLLIHFVPGTRCSRGDQSIPGRHSPGYPVPSLSLTGYWYSSFRGLPGDQIRCSCTTFPPGTLVDDLLDPHPCRNGKNPGPYESRTCKG